MSGTPDVATIAAALTEAISEGVPGLNTLDYLADNFTPPVAVAAIEKVDYHQSFRGGDVMHTFTVFVIVSRVDVQSAIKSLEQYMSQAGNPKSVQQAVEADPTLGGVVASAFVQSSGPPRAIQIGNPGASYLAIPFVVIVHA